MPRFYNRILISLTLVAAFFIIVAFSVQAQTGDVIEQYQVEALIRQDGIVSVTETIQYNFGNQPGRGIIRDIHLTSEDGPNIKVKIKRITDESGRAHPYKVSSNRELISIKIGDPNKYITGKHTYIIDYDVAGAIRFFDDHDELYWNAIGTEWDVLIKNANATVTLPQSFASSKVQAECFTGSAESKDSSFCKVTSVLNNLSQVAEVRVKTLGPLSPQNGLTVVAGFPIGVVAEATTFPSSDLDISDISSDDLTWQAIRQNPVRALKTGGLLSVGLVIFIVLLVVLILIAKAFSRVGFFFNNLKAKMRASLAINSVRKELKGRPIVTQFEPPEKLQPIDLGKMIDSELDVRDLVSVILDLAVRGYLTINYIPKQGWFGRVDYEFVKRKNGEDLTHPADKRIFKMLFEFGESKKLSALERSGGPFYETFWDLHSKVSGYLIDRGFLTEIKRGRGWLKALFAIALLAILYFSYMPVQTITLIILFVIAVIFIKIFNKISVDKIRFTDAGRGALAHLFGFRAFLALTEQKRLELVNAPELKPAIFERYLPYAIALHVEDKWAALFKNISIDLDWYKDQRYAKMNSTLLFLGSMRYFERMLQRTYTHSRPISRGRYSSGLGGGGRVGGGSGGGGGGRW